MVDLDVVEGNVRRMQYLARSSGKALRPHAKTHKSLLLARLQLEAGAVGVCAQKVSEAEVFVKGGVRDVLVSNEVLGSNKARRVAELNSLGSRVGVAVDSVRGVEVLENAASDLSVEVPVLLDVDVGMHRCGVSPGNASSVLAAISKARHLKLEGLMGYDGHSGSLSAESREWEVRRGWRTLEEVSRQAGSVGLRVEVISVGGTPTAHLWAGTEATELQPGTYVYNDAHQVELGVAREEEVSAFVVAQVVSSSGGRAVLDVGTKGVSVDQGYPLVVSHPGATVASMSEEHTVLTAQLRLEERVVLVPRHVCPTVDLWDEFVAFRGGRAVGKVRVDARGKKW
ncbi:alanine racemase [Sulfodiicoccus acidiphilus]|uniref:Alanine racemase n=1 Tax=Sulfodiicoccus acidiphilus TaxID=1670455 RepID=A0A830H2L9_9CREN|nr:alanine racemase [Sulfodiicoccus acidiphilus]GGT98781.1 alanine racemase [Sulfodiicoccus acidiphilus]